jgi:hypothetical protein
MGSGGNAIWLPVSAFLRISTGILLAMSLVSGIDRGRVGRETGGVQWEVLQPAGASECPSGWVCVWEDANFNGRMAMFHDCCAWNNLADNDLNNAVSSWRNRKAVDAKMATLADGEGDRLCLRSSSQDGSLGPTWNDTGSSLKVFAGDGAC